MRIDKFLKEARIIKRRTIANEACDAGRVCVNGRVAKAGVQVQVGDIIELNFGRRYLKLQVTGDAEAKGRDRRELLFGIIEEVIRPREED